MGNGSWPGEGWRGVKNGRWVGWEPRAGRLAKCHLVLQISMLFGKFIYDRWSSGGPGRNWSPMFCIHLFPTYYMDLWSFLGVCQIQSPSIPIKKNQRRMKTVATIAKTNFLLPMGLLAPSTRAPGGCPRTKSMAESCQPHLIRRRALRRVLDCLVAYRGVVKFPSCNLQHIQPKKKGILLSHSKGAWSKGAGATRAIAISNFNQKTAGWRIIRCPQEQMQVHCELFFGFS